MFRFTFMLLFLGGTFSVFSQTVADFENFLQVPDTFINNSGANGGFASGNVFLPNSYNPAINSWTGWSISSERDSITPGFTNQYSAFEAVGVDSSLNYAVGYAFDPIVMQLTMGAAGKTMEGFFVTNNTYAYLSMRDGDGFAKRFGGETGDDPDFFLLTIKKYKNGGLGVDSIDFYLADYRFTENTQDYIVGEWEWVDLSSLKDADSLMFSLSSSDTGGFGMNTPAYFCVDNVTSLDMSTPVEPNRQTGLKLYPNPAQDLINVDWTGTVGRKAEIRDIQGRSLLTRNLMQGTNSFSIGELSPGIYFLQIDRQIYRFVK